MPRASFSELLQASRAAAWGLGMPVIILGGIYGGVFTATEAAAVSVIYAAAVCVVIYGQLDLKELWDVCIDSGLASARILIMVGGATLFSWMLTITGTTAALVEPFAGLRSSPAQTLAFVNILALACRDVHRRLLEHPDPGADPLPMVTAAGISGTHFGVVMTVNTDIGNITPPFGLNLFVASGTFDRSYATVVRAVLPWLALALLSLTIITYVPEISLWLPRQLYPELQ